MRKLAILFFIIVSCSSHQQMPESTTKDLPLPDNYEIPPTEALTMTGNSYGANFSPDGNFIVFHSQQEDHDNFQIYELSIQNKSMKRITHQSGDASYASYHKSSPYIIYQSTTDEEKERPQALEKYAKTSSDTTLPPTEIYSSLRDGSGIVRKTTKFGYDGHAAFDASGKNIFFSRFTGKNIDLLRMTASGKRPKQLTRNSFDDIELDLSSRGDQILWQRKHPKKDISELYLMNSNGRGAYALTRLEEYHLKNPKWHPDAKQIIFSANLHGANNYEIYTMNIKDRCIYRLTYNESTDTYPAFHPDGKSFVFSSNRSGSFLIYKREFRLPETCTATTLPKKN